MKAFFYVYAMNKIGIIGHRGAKGHLPENTLASFQKAMELKCDGIELDVHLSADGEIIVIHDETVDRTTDGNGLVSKLSLSEIKALRIEGKHQIPTLSEVFELVNKKCFINIELKSETSTEPVIKLIEKYVSNKEWNHNHFLVSAFDWNNLQKIHRINPKIKLGVLTETDLHLAIAFAETIKAESIHPHFHVLTLENTLQMQKKGFKVYPWTVNESADIQKIKSFKPNGIITDFPDRI